MLSLTLRALSLLAKRQMAKARLFSFVAWVLVWSELHFAWSRLLISSWIRAPDQKPRGTQIYWHLPCLPWEKAKSPSAPSTSCLMALRVCVHFQGTKQYLMLLRSFPSAEHHAPGKDLSQCRGAGCLFGGFDGRWAGWKPLQWVWSVLARVSPAIWNDFLWLSHDPKSLWLRG